MTKAVKHYLVSVPERMLRSATALAAGLVRELSEVALPAAESSRNRDRTLSLDIPHYVRYRILRRNAQTHVHVISHQMPLYYLRLLVLR